MTSMHSHSEVRLFLDSVCSHVRAKKLHDEIKEELIGHLDEVIEENLANGMTEKEAVALAVSKMGEPSQIGIQLDYTHRPSTDWLMIALVTVLSVVGMLAMYSLRSYESSSFTNFFVYKLMFVGIGIVCIIILWACDYQRIKKYSEYIFGFALILITGLEFFGTRINGQLAWYSVGTFLLYVPMLAIVLMIIGLAGVKPLKEHSWKGSMLFIAYRGVLPILLLMKLNLLTLSVVYAVIFIYYLWLTKRSAWQVIPFVVSGFLLAIYILLTSPHAVYRIMGFLNAKEDPDGSGYLIGKFTSMIQSAGWWGQGELTEQIPYAATEGLLPSFINYYGWVAGIIVLLIILFFISRIVKATSQIKEEYGKLLFAGIGALFVLQFVWSIVMVFGYAPIVGLSLPFIGYGLNDHIIQFATIGLLLSIYRRRNMVAVQLR